MKKLAWINQWVRAERSGSPSPDRAAPPLWMRESPGSSSFSPRCETEQKPPTFFPTGPLPSPYRICESPLLLAAKENNIQAQASCSSMRPVMSTRKVRSVSSWVSPVPMALFPSCWYSPGPSGCGPPVLYGAPSLLQRGHETLLSVNARSRGETALHVAAFMTTWRPAAMVLMEAAPSWSRSP